MFTRYKKKIKSDLIITQKSEFKNLETLDGSLFIYSTGQILAPKLKTINGCLVCCSNCVLENLTEIKSFAVFTSNQNIKINLPNLKQIHEHLVVGEFVEVNTPELFAIWSHKFVNKSSVLDAPNLYITNALNL